jgi:hypothetical protein
MRRCHCQQDGVGRARARSPHRTDLAPAIIPPVQGNLTDLIYIGGYGRSGSTLLEYLLTASPKIVACGEVSSALRTPAKKAKKCTCGRPVSACPVWSRFQEQRRNAWTHQDLTLALLEQVKSEYQILVDSSKTAWGSILMPFKLRRRLKERLRLIHIVRDPRAVCWSAIKRAKWKEGNEPSFLRSVWVVLSWSVANLSCEAFGLFYRQQYLRLRYEDLTRHPRQTITGLLRVSSPDHLRFDNPGICANRHQLHGNRIRVQQLSISDVKEDVAWKKAMPPAHGRLVAALSWCLRRRYGYTGRNWATEK